MGTISQESARAWAPMQQVANAIPGDVPLVEVKAALGARLANPRDVGRLQAATSVLDDLITTQPEMTAPQLVDLSTTLSSYVRKAGLKGNQALTFSDIVYTDLKGAVADVLEMRAPQQMKGFVAQAKSLWSNYATDRDALFRYFQPGASANQQTAAGVNLLKRAALGQSSPYEQELLGRFYAASGIDLPESIRPIAARLMKARQSGERGKTISRVLPWLTGAGLAGEA